MTLVAD
jgi:hypothetical protein